MAEKWKPAEEVMSAETVRAYLTTHPHVLEAHLMEDVALEQLERWMIRRTQRDKQSHPSRKSSLSRWKFCVHTDKQAMLQELTVSLLDSPSECRVLDELARCISSAVSADGHVLYLGSEGPDLRVYRGSCAGAPHFRLENAESGDALRVAREVAQTLRQVRLNSGEPPPAWLHHPTNGLQLQEGVKSALFQPVMRSNGELIGVMQLWRRGSSGSGGEPFYEEDEEIVLSYLVWGGVAFHYAQLYKSINTQKKLHEFLLEVVRSIFQDMVSMDHLVVKIIDFAQHLVQADRASLFLVDSKTNELYARIFDCGYSPTHSKGKKDLRFPVGTGIAGCVAETGQLLNISDAYSDPRFNRNVDQITGYKTKSILCMPILLPPGIVIGVVQMVNKKTAGSFNKDDEKAFEMFAVYCGLALHHAKLFDKIRKSEQKYKVALEVLSYHNTCSEEEVMQVLPIPDYIHEIGSFEVNALNLNDTEKAQQAIYMFKDLFGFGRFDSDAVIRFTLTVRKNYRRVPYHNWSHGFSVANSMYSVLKNSKDIFSEVEALSLFIGALCHDLDHRGKNNKFMVESASPLANMYSTSTMEHHHFNQTVAILQQDGHNFLQKMEREEYRQILDIVKHCILATDLANFFPNKACMQNTLRSDSFDWGNTKHRSLVQAMAMTASDLSASAKPWEVQIKTVTVIFEEFYEQGDEERRSGRQPIPMMDRRQPEQQSASQVEFLSQICLPCYELLAKVLPGSEPLLRGCRRNLERWKDINASSSQKDVLGLCVPID